MQRRGVQLSTKESCHIQPWYNRPLRVVAQKAADSTADVADLAFVQHRRSQPPKTVPDLIRWSLGYSDYMRVIFGIHL